jgi:hypothetical protein
MRISSKILPAVALVFALSALTAQARGEVPPGPAQYYLALLNHHDQVLNHQDQVMRRSATIDHPETFYSDIGPNAFRDTMGG